jgi:hypothetical protein
MYGPGPGWGFGILWHVGAFFGGLVLAAALIVLTILLVRYLIVATRAAQLYVDAHSAPGATPPAATEPPPATPPVKPAPRPRTPKTPPAAL